MASSFSDSRINLQIILVNDSAYIYMQIYALLILRLKTLPLPKDTSTWNDAALYTWLQMMHLKTSWEFVHFTP